MDCLCKQGDGKKSLDLSPRTGDWEEEKPVTAGLTTTTETNSPRPDVIEQKEEEGGVAQLVETPKKG